jgi:ankyrin repeat protein
LDLVRVLIREGQDMNEQTQQMKNTPLHIAARHGHFLIVKYLLETKAVPNIDNRDDLTPFDFAEDARKSLELALVSKKVKMTPQVN